MKTLKKIYQEFISSLENTLRVIITTRPLDYQHIPIPVGKRIPPRKR